MPEPSSLRPWRISVFAIYFASGIGISAWLTRIPAISERLELGPAAMGALLLTQTVAAFASVSTSGMTVMRLGAKRSIAVTASMVVMGMILIGVGVSVFGSVLVTAVGMLLFGLGSATWNVASNVEGSALESAMGRSIMPLMHAFFSIAVLMRSGLVTVRSSPTIWIPDLLVKWLHASQSSWSKGSSIDTIGYFLM